MAQKNSDFWEGEQRNKSAELLQVRKDRGAQISKLKSENQDLSSEKASLEESLRQVRRQLEETQAKLAQAFHDKQQAIELAASKEEGLRQDLDATRRLLSLMEQQSNSQKSRLVEMEARVEQVKRDGEDAVRRISEELEQTRQAHEQATAEIESLHAEVGRLEAMLAGPRGSPAPPGSAPQTPRPLNGSLIGRPSSPFATPGSTRKVISTTQALEEMYRLKGLLAAEKKRNEHLAKEFDEMVDQLEAKGPEIDELQAENERLQHEIQNMSRLSDESFKERDVAKKTSRKAEAELKTAQVEINIARQQVRDLSAQMQMMIFNMEHQGQELTLEESLQLQRLERASGFATDDMSDVDALITERLVVFKNIKELQEKNQELLKVIHQLSEDMKSSEDAEAKQQAADDHLEVLRLRDTIKEWEDRVRSLMVQHEAIVKQRDMFRRLAETRGSNAHGSAIAGDNGVLVSIEENGDSVMGGEGTDYPTVIREMTQQYDSQRAEWVVDRDTMKKQIETLSSERNSLQSENSKLSSQVSLKDSRFEMLESSFKMSQSENEQLQKRIREQSENLSKQDIRTQQAAEDFVEARSQAEGLRNENANLKAEKKLWKDIQDRLVKDNESLTQEKSRLNNLLVTQQSLQNERDLSEAETKRRLQGQIDTLEAELNMTKRKLANEVDEGKKLQLRKEFDAQQAQKRIDELTANLSQIREELVGAKTSRDHLQSRVDELSIELRTAEERAERLQPRPTPRPGFMTPIGGQNGAQDSDERVQELIHEVSDLKRELELTKTHLENARAQSEQYKELSQSTEEQLQELHAAQDQYVQEMEASLNAKDATIKELEQRVEDLSAELARSNSELSTLRDSQEEVARHFQEEKSALEVEVKRLKSQEEEYITSSQFHQQDLRTQADIATSAQQQFEDEVARHGETAKALSTIRVEYNELRTAAATLRAEAESARATLLENESSWEDRRKKFEQELSELRARRDDADKQNKILHEQLQSVQTQVASIQRARDSANESMEAIAAQPTSTSEDGLREISNYLRREKDILEVQYDMQLREAKRLQETLNYTQSQLDETKLKLEQERQSQANSDRSTMSHKDLMEKLEQLNLFRESNAALRTEKRQLETQLNEKTAKVSELEEKIAPLGAQIEELNSQIEHKEAEINQIRTDRDYWQKRSEDIIAKHGRADPAEVEELKQTVETLEAERSTLQEAEASLRGKVEELEQAIQEKETGWQSTREKLVAQFKERSRNQSSQIKEANAEKDRLQGELESVQGQLESVQGQLGSERQRNAMADEQIRNFQQQVMSLQEEAQQLRNAEAATPASAPAPTPTPAPAPEPVATPVVSDTAASEQIAALESQLTQVRAELESITAQKATVDQELEGLRAQLESVVAERNQALAAAQSASSQPAAPNGDVVMENGTGDNATPAAPAPVSLSDEERQALEQRIKEAEKKAAEFETKADELEKNQNAIINSRSDKMKTMLNEKLKSKNAEIEKERADMKQDMKQAMDKQQEEFKLRMEQERKIWEAEQKSAPTELQPPATPAQQTAPGTPARTPAVSAPSLDNVSDEEARKFIANNATVKAIITTNVKNRVEAATKKLKEECEQNHVLKAEVEQKIAQAKESATKLAASKANLQVNMAENRARMAQAKIGVVETAAKDTPARPVVEVWEVAKLAKPPPVQPKQPVPAPSGAPTTPNTPTGRFPQTEVTRGHAANSPAAATAQQPAAPAATGAANQAVKPPTSLPKPPSSLPAAVAPTAAPTPNPFAPGAQPPAAQPATAAANPFAQSTSSQAGAQAQPAAGAGPGAPGPQAKTGIPAPSGLPKSNLRPPGAGPYQAPRGGARGGRGGRGGAHGGGRGNLNPGADNFQPGQGNKRPRGDSEAGGAGGAKRMRGGANGGAGQQ